MNPKIPEEAIPVRDWVRREVPRPKELPHQLAYGGLYGSLRWEKVTCPLGLLPCAPRKQPHRDHFKGMDLPAGITLDGIEAFTSWWDLLSDPEEAVREVWG